MKVEGRRGPHRSVQNKRRIVAVIRRAQAYTACAWVISYPGNPASAGCRLSRRREQHRRIGQATSDVSLRARWWSSLTTAEASSAALDRSARRLTICAGVRQPATGRRKAGRRARQTSSRAVPGRPGGRRPRRRRTPRLQPTASCHIVQVAAGQARASRQPPGAPISSLGVESGTCTHSGIAPGNPDALVLLPKTLPRVRLR